MFNKQVKIIKQIKNNEHQFWDIKKYESTANKMEIAEKISRADGENGKEK